MNEGTNHPVKTTEKSLELVSKLRDLDGARIHELTDELDMTKGAIHNHLSTLRQHGFVQQEGNVYHLTLQFLTLGGYVRDNIPLYQTGRPKAIQLADDTGMLVNLATEENGKGVYLYQARGEYAVNLDTHVGYRIRLHNIAVGKAILANLPRERIDEIVDTWGLPGATENTITEKEALLEELETVRERGYAIDDEERTRGLACIGAPVQVDDQVLGAISVSAPTRRLGDGNFDGEITGKVVSTANEIELDLKYN
ncbi:IclR family transcriptional regulator [Haloglomus halophilum]|uniref:IclR family transcriptional regulator n=1 Tax=Haloglomus halophilum TaxID=2962672 RepID=UPI0020C9D2B5|nr:IclR family transcriptional regulator [Haloglomus halophilum]